MRFDELNEDNYILFAIKNYDNPQAATKEDFFEDMRRFKYIKRLLKKYHKGTEVKLSLLPVSYTHLTLPTIRMV